MKKRVMLCNEACFLSTGFATYGLELLRRLHASGRYELMEFASYSEWQDQRAAGLPWAHKTAKPNPASEEEVRLYNSNQMNEFGEWKFEEACIEFRPDVVLDIRDWWMLEYQERSPFRPYFRWGIMPTVDAEPQDEQWLSTYLDADGVFAYSDWGLDLLKRQTGGACKTVASAPPGADFEAYRPPADRRAHRRSMGMDPDALVVGTVMRNQVRKLYPELMAAFRRFLDEAPPELAAKTFLYLHTGWPDLGWNIPRLIREYGLSAKTLVTYYCKACGASFASFFQDSVTACRQCGMPSAVLPSTQLGVSRKFLADVINTFDVYVQYANSEGFGMPQVEAAACGVPVMAVDYSAMSDVVRKVGGIPIRVAALVRDPHNHCHRAVPDEADFVAKLTDFLLKPAAVRERSGREARRGVAEHYDWDKTARRWMDWLDAVPVHPQNRTWLSQPSIHRPDTNVPANLSNEEFVRWGMTHVAGRPDLANSFQALRLTRDLNWGLTLGTGMGGMYYNDSSTLGFRQRTHPFDRDIVMNILLDLAGRRNHWEKVRSEVCRAN